MRKTAACLLVPVAASTLVVSGCGSKDSSTASSTTSSTAVATTTAGSASTAAATTASQCPTSNTRAFAKTRFVTDVGLAAGTFHRYIYKPYQAGSFAKGASKRTSTIVKAAAVAAIDAKLVDNAYQNVQASPALCKALIVPMGALKNQLDGLKSQITSGNLGTLATIDSLVKQVESGSAKNGATITEQDSVSSATQASNQG